MIPSKKSFFLLIKEIPLYRLTKLPAYANLASDLRFADPGDFVRLSK